MTASVAMVATALIAPAAVADDKTPTSASAAHGHVLDAKGLGLNVAGTGSSETQWTTAGAQEQRSPLNLSLLGANANLFPSGINLPLIFDSSDPVQRGLLDLGNAGLLASNSSSTSETMSTASSGVLNDDGSLNLSPESAPGFKPAKLDLSGLLSQVAGSGISETVLDTAEINIGALGSQLTSEEGETTSQYVMTQLDAQIHSQLVGNLVGTLTPALDSVLGDAETGLNGLVNTLVGDLVSGLLGVVDSLPLVEASGSAVNIDLDSLTDSVVDELLRSELSNSDGSVLVDLETGTISVNVADLLLRNHPTATSLNDLPANTAVLDGQVVTSILDGVTEALLGTSTDNPNGLMAKVEGLVKEGLYNVEVSIDLTVKAQVTLLVIPVLDVDIRTTVGGLLLGTPDPVIDLDVLGLGFLLNPLLSGITNTLAGILSGVGNTLLEPLIDGVLDALQPAIVNLIGTVVGDTLVDGALKPLLEEAVLLTINEQPHKLTPPMPGDLGVGSDTVRALAITVLPGLGNSAVKVELASSSAKSAEQASADATLTATPSTLEQGETVSFSGTGFEDGETVTITARDGVSETATANGNGEIAGSWTVPADYPIGAVTLTATGGTSGKSATTDITVTEANVPPVSNVNASASAAADSQANAAAQAAAMADATSTASAQSTADATSAASAAANATASGAASADISTNANAAASAAATASGLADATSTSNANSSAAANANAQGAASAAANTSASSNASTNANANAAASASASASANGNNDAAAQGAAKAAATTNTDTAATAAATANAIAAAQTAGNADVKFDASSNASADATTGANSSSRASASSVGSAVTNANSTAAAEGNSSAAAKAAATADSSTNASSNAAADANVNASASASAAADGQATAAAQAAANANNDSEATAKATAAAQAAAKAAAMASVKASASTDASTNSGGSADVAANAAAHSKANSDSAANNTATANADASAAAKAAAIANASTNASANVSGAANSNGANTNTSTKADANVNASASAAADSKANAAAKAAAMADASSNTSAKATANAQAAAKAAATTNASAKASEKANTSAQAAAQVAAHSKTDSDSKASATAQQSATAQAAAAVAANATSSSDASGTPVPPTAGKCDVTKPRAKSPFLDTPTNHKFYPEIDWMHCTKLSTGWKVSKGFEYRPSADMTREAMAAFIFRMQAPKDYKAPKTSLFTDVKPNHRFYREIMWMKESGTSTGYADGSYRPGAKLDRDAMAAFIFRMNAPRNYAPKTQTFVDVDKNTKFYKEIEWMGQEKLSGGYWTAAGPEYRPKNGLSREAMAAFIERLVNDYWSSVIPKK